MGLEDRRLLYSVVVAGQDGPWEFVKGGLNANFTYGVGDQKAPGTASAADGLNFAPGSDLYIQYVSGLEYTGIGPLHDANGLTSYPPANGTVSDHNNFPSYYFVRTDWPAYEGEIVGTFADSTGSIVGTPFNVGDYRVVVVPTGASQLELGYNDNFDEDNSGSITMSVTNQLVTTTTVAVTSSANPSVYGQPVTLSATVSPSTATGTVTFYDGTTNIGSGTLVNGTATLATSALPLGSDAITASYGGDANDPAGTSPVFNQVVNQDSTTTTVSASPGPQYVGQPVTVTATVSAKAPGSGTPTGSVTFFNGTTNLGTVTLNGSDIATISTSALPIGSNPITATYSGDTDFTTSTATAYEEVTQVATSINLVSSANPAGVNQLVTFTATVTPASAIYGTPTGSIIFQVGAGALSPVSLVNGVATFTTSFTPGTYAVTASYSQTADFAASMSNVVDEQVAVTTTTAASSPNPSVYGQSVTLSATVTPSTATGTVAFYDGYTSLGSGTLVNGIATLATSALPIGSNAITASYGGDANDASSTSPAFNQVVNQDGTTTTLTDSPNPQYVGQPVTLTATVSANAPGAGTPTGSVTFFDGSTYLGTVALNGSDIATLSTSALPIGSDPITTTYSGDSNFSTSTATKSEQVTLIGTSVSLVSSANPTKPNQPLMFTATVTPASGIDGTPTGSIVFLDSAGASDTATLVNGVATFTTSFPPGTYLVTASYGAAGDFAASTSNVVYEQVSNYALTTLASFNGFNNGGNPDGLILDGQGNLYGTTEYGGYNSNGESLGDGTVFEIASGSNSITDLAQFDGTGADSAAYPLGGVVMDSQGDLFGTTEFGGGYDEGSVFEVVKGSNTASILASFSGGIGAGSGAGVQPQAGVVMDAQGNLYGTTTAGGAYGVGTVFELPKGSNTFTTLVSFNSYVNGGGPDGRLALDSQGDLFGMTTSGGDYGQAAGTVFELAKGSNTLTTLGSFTGTNGAYPEGGVILDAQGDIYGTTRSGGAGGIGTVFEIASGSNTITTLASFNGANGEFPQGEAVLDGQGNVFGTTQYGGANNDGTVFEIAKGSNTVTTLASFTGTNGNDATEGVVLDGNGNLYGTTYVGGAYNEGTVYELSPALTELTSHVINSLATAQSTDSFPVSVSFSETGSSGGTPVSGVSSVSLYYSVNNGPFTLYQTQNLGTPTASGTVTFSFTGQDRNLYAFHSVAEDAAGNVETKAANAIEASTCVPDLNPPVTHVQSSSSYSNGVFTINWAGTDPDQNTGTPPGSIVTVDIYVQIDGGTPTLIAQAPGGTPSGGVYSGSLTYNALADGMSHSYSFFSIGIDDQQEAQDTPVAPDVTFSNIIYSAALTVQPVTVQKGIVGRSFIQYLDVDFSQTASTSPALSDLANGLTGNTPTVYVELLWYGENLTTSSLPQGSVNLFGTGTSASVTLNGNDLSINFGPNGITSLLTENGVSGTGSPTSKFGDGWYALGIDPTGNPSNGQVFWQTFFRLLGNTNGTGVVTGPYTTPGTDASNVYHAEGQSGPLLSADADGNGVVNSKDFSETVLANNDAVGSVAPMNFPQFQLFAGVQSRTKAVAVTQAQVQTLLPVAIEAWAAAGLNAADVQKLEAVKVQVANLGTSILGLEAANTILINQTAAGSSWYLGVSSTQAFGLTGPGGERVAGPGSPAAGEVDLLTVLEHELGHVLDLPDNNTAGDLMDITLGLGVSRSPSASDLAAVEGVADAVIATSPNPVNAVTPIDQRVGDSATSQQPSLSSGSVSQATVDAALASLLVAAVGDDDEDPPVTQSLLPIQPLTRVQTIGVTSTAKESIPQPTVLASHRVVPALSIRKNPRPAQSAELGGG